ncbi:MAG TPA: hypothetical protein DHV39_15700 [Verrucomicrobiales bacterium]|nr:hypothetical protein [Verrucomicrobiales bacterium]HCZ04833.1 hypothetical protein [Verrucomicrobiales bacterium]
MRRRNLTATTSHIVDTLTIRKNMTIFGLFGTASAERLKIKNNPMRLWMVNKSLLVIARKSW